MWSLGVILYVLLSGVPPFDDEGLYEQIREARFEFDVPEWKVVTPDAKDLVLNLMTVNPKQRLTINQALNHRWLRFSPPSSPPRDAAADAAALGTDDLAQSSHHPKRRRTDDGYYAGTPAIAECAQGIAIPQDVVAHCADLSERLIAVAACANSSTDASDQQVTAAVRGLGA
jgi:serine/threonine protein kinase